MYMASSGGFASTTHYMTTHPAWASAFNSARPADRYFRAEWKPLLSETGYTRSLPDSQPWFGPRGGKLPMGMNGAAADTAPGPAFYSALMSSPFGDALSLDFARAAMAGESLGKDDAPDILVVSLSSHDYINHAYSAESRLSHDHLLQLDRLLQAFFRDLDAAVGPDNYVAVLTADHGFMPAPEVSLAKGLLAGRVNGSQMLARLNAGLAQRFGEGPWVTGISASSLLLDKKTLAQKGADSAQVADEARRLLLAEPGFAAAYTRRELLASVAPLGATGAPFFAAMRRSWHPDVSGEVQFVLQPNWMFASSSNVTTHGSPHAYDTQVPLLLYGPRWVRPGRVDVRVDMVDLAPTLARFLKLAPPPGFEGKPLPLPNH